MTYRELLDKYKGHEDIEIDAIYFLIEEDCHVSRSSLLVGLDRVIENDKLLKDIDTYVNNRVPVQYIMGYTYFYKDKFKVNNNVLIPRFDTEVLVDQALEIMDEYSNPAIVDVGTGSGCIAITLKKYGKQCTMDAIDISSGALMVARENAELLGADVNFIQNDLFTNLDKKYDIIVSNPPYIEDRTRVQEIVKENEPSIALYSEDLYHYKKIIDASLRILNEKGAIIFEIDDDIFIKLKKYVKKYYNHIDVLKDYNGIKRVMIIKKR